MSTNGNMDSRHMTGAAQTMLTWVKVLQSTDEIPTYYQANIQQLILPGQHPYMLLIPPLKNQRNKPAERLLILLENVLHIFEKRGKKIIPDQLTLHPGIDLEMGNALLYSWVTFRELTPQNSIHLITLPFNTATARHLDPIIQLVKPVLITPDENKTLDNTPHPNLISANFKYNAFARDCITNNTRVINSLWQPTLLKKVLQIFGKTFYQNISVPHYLMLTNQEVIILWDDENSVENRGVRYGGIRRFIPRTLITNMSHIKIDDDYCKLSIKLLSGETIEQRFTVDAVHQIKQFITDFESSAAIH